jgi:NAD(P)-dependent dehydrogenase (short-subunit alcohol dehydrogenase family)
MERESKGSQMTTTPDPYSLVGKAAIVVGSANGIGRAIALELARAGASVACVDLDGTGARKTVSSILDSDGAAVAIRCDVSMETQARMLQTGPIAPLGGSMCW